MGATDAARRSALNGGSHASVDESSALRPKVAAVVIPLAVLVLIYPRQTLSLLTRLALTVQAVRVGLQLRDNLGRLLARD